MWRHDLATSPHDEAPHMMVLLSPNPHLAPHPSTLAQAFSPPVRALKPSAATGIRPPMGRSVKRNTIAACSLILLSLAFAFGLFGPSGVVTATALTASLFLATP